MDRKVAKETVFSYTNTCMNFRCESAVPVEMWRRVRLIVWWGCRTAVQGEK